MLASAMAWSAAPYVGHSKIIAPKRGELRQAAGGAAEVPKTLRWSVHDARHINFPMLEVPG